MSLLMLVRIGSEITTIVENVLMQLATFRDRPREMPRTAEDLRMWLKPWCELRREIDPQELVDELLMLEYGS